MSESSAPAACPQGHDDTVKLLSTVAVGGRAAARPRPGPAAVAAGAAAAPAAVAELRLCLAAPWLTAPDRSGREPLDLTHLVRRVERGDLIGLG